MRYFFSPRASATLVLPYVQSSGTDVATSRDVEAGGPGDVSVAVSWDVLGSGAAGPEGDVVLSDERTAPGSETEAARTLGVLVAYSF